MFKQTHKPDSVHLYETNINKVITYISQKLDSEFTLDKLCKVSGFSKFHFSRLFKAFVGETPLEFIKRLRLEKAAFLLLYNPKQAITQIALDCGFSSSQNLAKAFRLHFKESPSNYRKKYLNIPLSKQNSPLIPKKPKGLEISYREIVDTLDYNYVSLPTNDNNATDGRLSSRVTVKQFPDLQVAFVRGTGTYNSKVVSATLEKLFLLAKPRGLISASSSVLSVFWDNAATTPGDKCRVDCCVILPKHQTPKNIAHQTLKGGLVALYRCEIQNDNFYDHWNLVLKHWLPASGYQLDHRPCFEMYHNVLAAPTENLIMDICIPIL